MAPPDGTDVAENRGVPPWPAQIAPREDWAELILLAPAAAVPPRHARRRRALRKLALLLALVALPTALTGGYFYGLAVDRYQAEASFIVRKPNALSGSLLPNVSPEQSLQGGDEDAYAVRDYILSRDGLAAVLAKTDFPGMLARAGRDPLWRYPGPLTGASQEHLFRLYLSLVRVAHDNTAGITDLRVTAFNPADAASLAASLIDAAEALLNRLQARQQQAALQVAEAEVKRSGDLATQAQQALTAFRAGHALLDPALAAQSVISTITALSLEAVDARARLALLAQGAADSPQIPSLRARVAALAQQIAQERQDLAGRDSSLAPLVAEYERLTLLREFAVRSFIAALQAREVARLDLARQRVYLERVVQPSVTDRPAGPYRLASVLLVFGVGLLAWRLVAR